MSRGAACVRLGVRLQPAAPFRARGWYPHRHAALRAPHAPQPRRLQAQPQTHGAGADGGRMSGGGDEGPSTASRPTLGVRRAPRSAPGSSPSPGKRQRPRTSRHRTGMQRRGPTGMGAAGLPGLCSTCCRRLRGAMLGPRCSPPPPSRAPGAAPRPLTSVAQRQPQQLQQLPARLAHVQAEHGRAAPGPRGGSAGGGGSRCSAPGSRCALPAALGAARRGPAGRRRRRRFPQTRRLRCPPPPAPAPRRRAAPAPLMGGVTAVSSSAARPHRACPHCPRRVLCPQPRPPARTPRTERQPRDRGVS